MPVPRQTLPFSLPPWAPAAALLGSLLLAWLNFLGTARWADQPGALHGAKKWWYGAALGAATLITLVTRRRLGQPVAAGRVAPLGFVLVGAAVLVSCLLLRLPPSAWSQIPFDDDWTPLFQAAVNGVRVLERGSVMAWNWSFLGGYPTSTDVAQSFATHAFVPMTLLGDRVGFHVLHGIWFLSIPFYVWWDVRQDDRRTGLVAAALACFMTASISVTLGKSGDVNSLAGLCSAGLALVGSRAASLGRRWGGPALILGLTAALYSHVAFFVYAGIYLVLEAVYFRDRRAMVRSATAAVVALAAALPVHWESFRYPEYVSFNNVVYAPGTPVNWGAFWRTVYYNLEILVLPHRWFNDYRSLVNICNPIILIVALVSGRSRVGFYASAALLTQALLRLNTGEFGAGFDRIMHTLPMLAAPALAGFLLRCAGTPALAASLAVVLGLYGAVSFRPVPHVSSVRDFDPPLIDRLATLDGNLVLFEVSPHRDMDSAPDRRTPKAPWNVHFESLLPAVAAQRFYSQMWDGWTWSTWRGQAVGGGAFAGRAIGETPPAAFAAEMRRWGVRHLLIWTDVSRSYLAESAFFVERWRHGVWSHFELRDADVRSAVAVRGSARLTNLDPLSADVELHDVAAGDPIIVRTNFYPAWEASVNDQRVPLYAHEGQLAFTAPSAGSYVVRLEYPRRHLLSIVAIASLLLGMLALAYWPRSMRRGPDLRQSTAGIPGGSTTWEEGSGTQPPGRR